MKIQIRQSTFETNSSSVHTLVLPKGNCEQVLKPDKHGEVRVSCDDFSECGVVYGLHEKLSYLCSFIALDHPGDVRVTSQFGGCMSSEDCWDLENILEAIQRRYPDVLKLVATHCYAAQFDHQTHPCNSSCIINLWDIDQIETFLFNDDIKINMGRD